jgi:hypothetical protein
MMTPTKKDLQTIVITLILIIVIALIKGCAPHKRICPTYGQEVEQQKMSCYGNPSEV